MREDAFDHPRRLFVAMSGPKFALLRDGNVGRLEWDPR